MLVTPGTVIGIGIRHGRTAFNKNPPRLRAWSEIPLDRMGELDAQVAAQNLRQYNPKIIYSSDLTRDTQMAQIIGNILHIPNEVDFGIRTADMGEWTGMTEDETRSQVSKWYRLSWTYAPSGESYNSFLERFFDAIDPKLKLAWESESFRPLVFVSHGRNMAALDERSNHKLPGEGITQMPGGLMLLKARTEYGDYDVEFIGETESILVDR